MEKREEETLMAREHMFGKFDTVVVAGGVKLPCHRYLYGGLNVSEDLFST